ncbi:hypothetical protein [Nocardia sp. NPDC003963]
MSTNPQSTVGADPDGMGQLANKFRASATVVGKQPAKVDENMIEVGDAGYGFKKQGEDIHRGLEKVKSRLSNWSEAGQLTGDGIARGSAEYSNTDRENSNETEKAAS